MGFGEGFGGAEYSGRSSSDTARYIDNSQGVAGFRFHNAGHPRNHVSIPNHSETEPCVENYSAAGQKKSGFLSRDDQNFVGHYVLSHTVTQAAMDDLNNYANDNTNKNYTRSVVNLSVNELKLPRNIQCGQWENGKQTDTFDLRTITIVLQHFNGQENNPKAPVHILTFYPRYQ